jgi:transcriptional regulator with XRE-family HTH domain
MKQIGDKIRKIRELRGFSQDSVARDLGIGQGSYSKIESGDTDLSYSRLEQIAQILKTTISELVNFDEERILNNYYNGGENNTNLNNGNIYLDKLLLEEMQKAHQKTVQSLDSHINDLKTDNVRLHEIITTLLSK